MEAETEKPKPAVDNFETFDRTAALQVSESKRDGISVSNKRDTPLSRFQKTVMGHFALTSVRRPLFRVPAIIPSYCRDSLLDL